MFILSFSLLVICQPTNQAQPLAQGKSKFLGNVITSVYYANFTDYWNQVTPGNAGKWGSVEAVQDAYNWIPLDNIYNYALSKGIKYKHHTLVWGQQQPSWITSLDSANQRAQVHEWIKLVCQRYPKMNYVDVVNEPINAPPAYSNALGGAGKTGWDWVVTSFLWARQYADTGVKLILNEYNVLHNNTTTDNFLKLIDTLRVRNLIDGIGIQGHYFEFKGSGYTYPIATIQSNLNRLVATGIPFYITEFDINEPADSVQLQNYKTYFPIFWENTGVKGMTLWGYVQYDMWKADAYLLTERMEERPAMVWLKNYIKSPLRPALVSPVSTVGEPRNPLLVWRKSDSATSYRVQLSANSVFASILIDTTISDTSVRVQVLEPTTRYFWRVAASNSLGTSDFTGAASFYTGTQIVEVKERMIKFISFNLMQNYPNPFNPDTKISFSLPERANIKLVLCDMLGRELRIIAQGEYNSGVHDVTLNCKNLPSGIYIYRLEAGKFTMSRKLVLLK